MGEWCARQARREERGTGRGACNAGPPPKPKVIAGVVHTGKCLVVRRKRSLAHGHTSVTARRGWVGITYHTGMV